MNRGRLPRVSSLALVVGIAMLLGACAPSPGDPGRHSGYTREVILQRAAELRERGFLEQAEFLAEGTVTEESYRRSVDLLRECVSSMGFTMSEAFLSPITGVTLEFVYHSNGLEGEEYDRALGDCEDRYWSFISGVYRGTAPQRMAEPLRVAVEDCLRAREVGMPEDARSYPEMLRAAPQDADEITSCVSGEARRLYPEIPTLTLVG